MPRPSAAQGPFGLVHVVRDAGIRAAGDISEERRRVTTGMSAVATGRALRRFGPL